MFSCQLLELYILFISSFFIRVSSFFSFYFFFFLLSTSFSLILSVSLAHSIWITVPDFMFCSFVCLSARTAVCLFRTFVCMCVGCVLCMYLYFISLRFLCLWTWIGYVPYTLLRDFFVRTKSISLSVSWKKKKTTKNV